MAINDQRVLVRRVRLAVAELDKLTVLPEVAAQIAKVMSKDRSDFHDLLSLVQLSPELTTTLLRMAYCHGRSWRHAEYRWDRLAERLPQNELMRTFLEVRPFTVPNDTVTSPTLEKGRHDLVVHSVAVALAAKGLADRMDTEIHPDLAYSAGLLHDLGKLAMQQVMPKGYMRLVQASHTAQGPLRYEESRQLGVDHCQLGAYLAQRWHLPKPIVHAIRLHHQAPCTSLLNSQDFTLAAIVQLANAVAKSQELGTSGSFDTSVSFDEMAASLGITHATISVVSQDLKTQVDDLWAPLKQLHESPQQSYGQYLHDLALTLSKELDQQLQQESQDEKQRDYLTFMRDLIGDLDAGWEGLDVSACCVKHWQRFFRSGKVCLFLFPQPDQLERQLVVLDELAQCTKCVLDPNLDDWVEEAPEGTEVVLADAVCWEPLFEEIEVPFALNRTRTLVLRAGGHPVGALAFEVMQPSDLQFFKDYYLQAANVIATVLNLVAVRESTEDMVDNLLSNTNLIPVVLPQGQETSTNVIPEPSSEDLFDALGEMAAGFAHELNNPLSVISGRAQLLTQELLSDETRQSLNLIQENVQDVAQLVEVLLGFAQPTEPRRSLTQVTSLIHEAIAMMGQKLSIAQPDVTVHCPDNTLSAWIDSAQIVGALANILTNAIQAYEQMSPGRIEVSVESLDEAVKLQVRDYGCGMDESTLKQAMYPFFSSKQAGRRRGMGLAYAQRLILINGGGISLDSTLGEGTTVTITLPLQEK